MTLIRRIFGYGKPLLPTVPSYFFLILIATVFSILNLAALTPILQLLFDQVSPESTGQTSPANLIESIKLFFYQSLQELILIQGKGTALFFLCVGVVISVALANLFRYLSQLILARIRVRIIQNLRKHAFETLMLFNLDYFIKHKKGDLISRINSDVQDIEQSVVSSVKILLKEPFLILGYLLLLFSISVPLTFYALLLVPIAGLLVSIIGRSIRKWAKQSQSSLGEISNMLDETISGVRIIKAFNAEKVQNDRFSEIVRKYAKQTFQIALKSNLSSPISEVVGVIVISVIIFLGGREVLSNEMQAASLITFIVVCSQLLVPIKSISVSFGIISKGLASADRIFEVIDSKPKIHKEQIGAPLGGLSDRISLKNVSFGYDKSFVIKDISFEIVKGTTVALLGSSGAGKSTICDLLCRFYEPDSGQIEWDGLVLSAYALKDLRQQIGIVSQDAILFHDTIENNIRLGAPLASRKEVEAAAKQANIHDFIESLPLNYETIIGEQGNRLSGGQKQRITIARAILTNPALLILDEATSSQDAVSRMEIQSALNKAKQDRTTLFITHQLDSSMDADKIIIIEDGKVNGSGSHRKLLEENILYQQLFRLQSI